MTTLHNEIIIDAPANRVWAALSELEALSHYDPGVESVSRLEGGRAGVGAGRRCVLRDGGWFEERVTEWDGHHVLAFELVACVLPVRSLRHRYLLTEEGAVTRVEQRMEYQLKYGPFGAALDALVVRKKWDAGIKAFLAGLKTHVEGARGKPMQATLAVEAR
jgi:ligand-binding SRPBCC domain-containing protein